jgi:predicted GIY-YIG superfamily endonuclease
MTHIYALVSGQLILYVGKTGDMKEREYGHRSGGCCHSKYIPKYIDWTMKLLETVPNDQAITKEQYYYDTLKPLYNNKRPGQTSEQYQQSKARKDAQRKYQQLETYKKAHREACRKYYLKKKSEAPVADDI